MLEDAQRTAVQEVDEVITVLIFLTNASLAKENSTIGGTIDRNEGEAS